MITMTQPRNDTRRVFGGVDTHKDVHVAAVLNELGRLLGTGSLPTAAAGYRELLPWLCSHGEVVSVGIEGTGSWGAGAARPLSAQGRRWSPMLASGRRCETSPWRLTVREEEL